MNRRIGAELTGCELAIYEVVRECTRHWYLDTEASELAGEPVLARYIGAWWRAEEFHHVTRYSTSRVYVALRALCEFDVLTRVPMKRDHSELEVQRWKRQRSEIEHAYILSPRGAGELPHPEPKPKPDAVEKPRLSTDPRFSKQTGNAAPLNSGRDLSLSTQGRSIASDARARANEPLSVELLVRNALGLGPRQEVTSAASPRLVSEAGEQGEHTPCPPEDLVALLERLREAGFSDAELEHHARLHVRHGERCKATDGEGDELGSQRERGVWAARLREADRDAERSKAARRRGRR